MHCQDQQEDQPKTCLSPNGRDEPFVKKIRTTVRKLFRSGGVGVGSSGVVWNTSPCKGDTLYSMLCTIQMIFDTIQVLRIILVVLAV